MALVVKGSAGLARGIMIRSKPLARAACAHIAGQHAAGEKSRTTSRWTSRFPLAKNRAMLGGAQELTHAYPRSAEYSTGERAENQIPISSTTTARWSRVCLSARFSPVSTLIRRLHLMPPLLVILTLTGCASIGNMARRAEGEPLRGSYDSYVWSQQYVYAGLEADLRMIVAPGQEGIAGQPQSGAAYAAVPIGLFDAPLSLAVDTVVLPYDLWMVTAGGHTRKYESRDQHQFVLKEATPFLGGWTNKDLTMPEVNRVRISLDGDKVRVQAWGKGRNSVTEWGSESDACLSHNRIFVIAYQARETVYERLSLLPDGSLKMIYSHHGDDNHMVDTKLYFAKE
jgi:uncharacterized protein YceK